MTRSDSSALERRLRRGFGGEARFDRFTRGLYAADASIYEIEPAGVAFPTSVDDVAHAVEAAGECGLSVVPRGAGTSMSGQAIGPGLVLDTSRALDAILDFDPASRRIVVEPGLVLDRLNAFLRPHGLFFPVDVATSSRATIGGMAGNNSAGSRSIRYGHMVEHVLSIEAVLADGGRATFGPSPSGGPAREPGRAGARVPGSGPDRRLTETLAAIHAREADELARRIPRVPRHVAGYALHRLGGPRPRWSDILVGSEGTLAFFTAIELALSPRPAHRVLGVCRFRSVRDALAAVPALVALDPTAVELVDRAMLSLAAGIPTFRPALARLVGRGDGDAVRSGRSLRARPSDVSAALPGALLIVEFAGDDPAALETDLDRLSEAARENGTGDLVRATTPERQAEVWGLRKAGLNIAMSMKRSRKPIAFIEDCAIPLPRLPEWHDRLSKVFERHETRAIWYAHASVGTLHIRPALDLDRDDDLRRLRAIAEEAFQLAKELGGSHSGEHGDGIVRSEFLEPMLGARLVRAFEDVKRAFDPTNRLNPGKIVRPPRMDDRSLLRRRAASGRRLPTALDWSEWGGLESAVDMCNDNGTCRKRDPGIMCPSFRATADERHSTRGRANALRLALNGSLGPDPWRRPELKEAMALCIGCKGCKRECPTGVDMARMKIEYQARARAGAALSVRDRAVAWLPRYAPWVGRAPFLANLRNRVPALARIGERLAGFDASRPLPEWAAHPFRAGRWGASARVASPERYAPHADGRDVVLFVDTFTTWFEPENARAAIRVLEAAGYQVRIPAAARRPACCGRTFLNVGLVEEASREVDRTVAVLAPFVDAGTPIIGLEPSCLLTLVDEAPVLRPGDRTEGLAEAAVLFSEFIGRAEVLDRLELGPLAATAGPVHAHCHEKAFGLGGGTLRALAAIPGFEPRAVPAGCCGMAGSFGYEREHAAVSRRIAEIEILPHIRAAGEDEIIVASGTSCRHQIADLGGREALHPARVLERALTGPT